MDINNPRKIANDLKEIMPASVKSSEYPTVADHVVDWAKKQIGFIINKNPVTTRTFVVDGYNDYKLGDSNEPAGSLHDYLLANGIDLKEFIGDKQVKI